ncbi:hypothetical protein EPD60_06550 [Flaviaesturariibacter flavus]|uniref:DUF6434 domain-containing protein n=1 Tax=Flaviaesturariibacter flavus TaxID=2502780 RepID=A0A4R1BKJ7_9BACT|nr:DUF6434 domain-containing protein [Flaviaesturariibacter flavus]TCJ17839.1 hypothetical protein EPD60_06550 [Flaviaesturariibacter flavus]
MKKPTIDWHHAPLQKETVITENFRLTQNVRRFFQEHLHREVRFSRGFMEWLRANTGGNLGDALEAYRQGTSAESGAKKR